MAFYALDSGLPIPYIVVMLNSEFIAEYINNFINNTQTFGIDDARQIIVVIPTKVERQFAENLLIKAVSLKMEGKDDSIVHLQKEVDSLVNALYMNL